MVGLCGTTGESSPTPLIAPLTWTGREHRCTHDGPVSVVGAFHDADTATQPARTVERDALVWVWGEIWGCDESNGYEPRAGSPSDAADYCAARYDRNGIRFVERLNGAFAVVVHDRATRTLYLSTDRFGTHPLFYAETTDGGLAFSTSVQSLPLHPEVATDFDVDSLVEYVTQGRISGTYTAFEGVSEVSPGSTMAVDLDTGERATATYWRPVFQPRTGSFASFVTEFCTVFSRVLAERFAAADDETVHGLLLSGGSDSRLLLAATDQPLATYHMADRLTREARTARRVAAAAGRPFRLLERGSDYQATLLAENPRMMNFNGRFTQGHTTGFVDELASEIDVAVTGLFSDCLFKGYMLPSKSLSVGPLGTLHLPVEAPTETADDVLTRRSRPVPAYLPGANDLDTVLRERLTTDESAVIDHGVRYESLREFVSLIEFYPFSNDADLFYWTLTQSFTHWTPFLDNRVVDFALRYPTAYRLRYNLVDAAIARLSPALAAIPHAGTGVPVKHGFPLSFVWRNVSWLRRRTSVQADPAAHEPWPPDRRLATGDPLVLRALLEKRELVEALPFLDWEGVLRTYCEHADGEDRLWELYGLASLLHMPAVEALARRQATADGVTTESPDTVDASQPTAVNIPLDSRRHAHDGEHSTDADDGATAPQATSRIPTSRTDGGADQ